MVFTCTTNTGLVSWADNLDGNGGLGYNSANGIGQPPRQLGIFKLALVSVNGSMFVSTATVDNVTYSQSSSNIYCSADVMNFNDMDTLTIRGELYNHKSYTKSLIFIIYIRPRSTWFTYCIISSST